MVVLKFIIFIMKKSQISGDGCHGNKNFEKKMVAMATRIWAPIP